MLTERRYPLFLTHIELDRYLARGWYRMNQMIFTCHFIYFNEGIYSPVWIRLALQDFKFKKRLRKMIVRNKQLFTVVSKPARIDIEKETLFRAYRQHFKGQLAESLQSALMDSTNINIYDTQEICVYKDDRLVAVSFFDKGARSVASIKGIYDPAFAKYSLGLFTMLMEIEWAKDNGKLYYYPGYVIPGRPRFDYKLRIGNVDYYDPNDHVWKPHDQFNLSTLPIQVLKNKLITIRRALEERGIYTVKIFYPLFEEELIEFHDRIFMKFPLFLSCAHRDDNLYPLVLEYDLLKDCYRLSRFDAIENQLSIYTNEMADRYEVDLCCIGFLCRDILLIESNSIDDIASTIIRYGFI